MKWTSIIVCITSILGLISVRAFEGEWFYDPMLQYFKEAQFSMSLPHYEGVKLSFHHLYRFLLNSIFSLGLIYGLYKNVNYLKISIIIMWMSFLLCYPFYYYMLETDMAFGYAVTFFLRRLVIQPMPLFLLIPLFYYLRKKQM